MRCSRSSQRCVIPPDGANQFLPEDEAVSPVKLQPRLSSKFRVVSELESQRGRLSAIYNCYFLVHKSGVHKIYNIVYRFYF
jgi:hypothetical protein